MVIPNVSDVFGSIQKSLEKRDWKLEEESMPYWPQHYQDWLEYLEESWRPEGTCCQSDSSERPSANAGVTHKE